MPFHSTPTDAFTTVEEIMREVPSVWRIRYLLYGYGWLLGLFYFVIIWFVSRALLRRDKNETT